MKKLIACVLALMLAIPTALAMDVAALFPAARAAIAFPDVASGAWYESAAALCYETGLLNGTDYGFSPNGTVTVAEAATLAARMDDILSGGTGTLPASNPWYASAVAHMEKLGVTGITAPERAATRQDFFILLSVVLTIDHLPAMNSIQSLPDTSDRTVLAFYNAGILTGTDAYGTFSAAKTLTRAEMAVMAARIIRPELRERFTPQAAPAAPSTSAGLPDGAFATLNGVTITREHFITALEQEFRAVGFVVDWAQDYGVGDLNDHFRNRAMSAILSDILATQFAVENGLPTGSLDEIYDALVNYVSGGELRAKHILFSTVDGNSQPLSDELQAGALQKAELFSDVLQYTPTEAQFDELMQQSEDPGLASYPNGYVFGKGEMVSEFENAVLGMEIGEISGIVRSAFGYHIIMRLDPQGDPEGMQLYISDRITSLLNSRLQQSDMTTGDALQAFDVKGYYQTWLASQS